MWASRFSLLRPQSSPSSAAAPPSPSLDNHPAGSRAGLCDSVPCSPSQSVEKHLTLTLQEQTLVLLHRLSACPHRSHTVSTSTSGLHAVLPVTQSLLTPHQNLQMDLGYGNPMAASSFLTSLWWATRTTPITLASYDDPAWNIFAGSCLGPGPLQMALSSACLTLRTPTRPRLRLTGQPAV